MVDHVFGDRRKQPQPREADYQPEREVQPEIFAAREARSCKHPQALGACDEPRAISLEPPPTEHEPHDQGDEQRPRQTGLTHVMLEPRQIAAEHVAQRANNPGPTHRAERIVEHETAVRHPCRSREHGGPGAQQRDEAADEDGRGAVPPKEVTRTLEVGFVEVKEAPISPHQRYAALTPDPITAVVADHGRSHGGCHDSIDREMSQRREGGRRPQGGLAWEREPETLEADQEEENDVAVGCNEPRYGLLHTATLVTCKFFAQRGCNPGAKRSIYDLGQVFLGAQDLEHHLDRRTGP